MYVLPSQTIIDINYIQQLIQQLPSTFNLMGDFNTHNTLWGSTTTDRRKKNRNTYQRLSKPVK